MNWMENNGMIARNGEPVNDPDPAKVRRRRRRPPMGESARMAEARKQGRCPHSGRACRKAKVCDLDKLGSCASATKGLVNSCAHCRKKFKACGWKCFR